MILHTYASCYRVEQHLSNVQNPASYRESWLFARLHTHSIIGISSQLERRRRLAEEDSRIPASHIVTAGGSSIVRVCQYSPLAFTNAKSKLFHLVELIFWNFSIYFLWWNKNKLRHHCIECLNKVSKIIYRAYFAKKNYLPSKWKI